MSITRILCEKCGFPMAHCSCVSLIGRAIDVAFNSVLQMKLSAHGKAKFIEEFKRELEKAVPARWGNDRDEAFNECRKLMGLSDGRD